jgi:hypothetical protein
VFFTKGKDMFMTERELYIEALARAIDAFTVEQCDIMNGNYPTQTRLDAILLIQREKKKLERQLNRLL